VTAWNIAFAVVVVVWAFRWTGGKGLVAESYADAKVRVAEQKAQRAARKEEERVRREAEGGSVFDRVHRRGDDTGGAEPVGDAEEGRR
jgi:hypothetical protein